VQLAAVALWTSKRSQVLAPHARLNHRQSHGRIASDALRALVLFVEHALPLSWAGGHPFYRMGLGDDLIDVIAIDALKHAPLESET
jgi:hypothetical protein